jgi:hypothetical protein
MIGILLLLLIIASVAWFGLRKPSNDRNWAQDQKILAYADINDNLITIHNVRNFTYRTTDDYTPGYYDQTYDLNKIKGVSYVVEPFSDLAGPAHTFVTFEFEDKKFVSVSIEIRKQAGQVFSGWKSAFNVYELMYVIADERDVVKLRSNYRQDIVYMYPMRSADNGRGLFLDMIKRANKLKDQPEFYNLFTSTCTTNIVDHVNNVVDSENRIPWSISMLLPSYSDKFAYDLGLINTDLPFAAARNKYFINQRADKYANDPDFSSTIRDTSL